MLGWLSRTVSALAICIGCISPAALAQQSMPPDSLPSVKPLRIDHPITLQGTLGEARVQVSLRPKVPADEGIEGEYFIFGMSHTILLAGEIEDEALFMEESENGKDISGQWEGIFDHETVRGKWMSADGSIEKAFALELVRPSARHGVGNDRSGRTPVSASRP